MAKPTRIKSKKLTNAARGKECTMQVIPVCNSNPETTISAHVNVEGGKMGGKTDDISAVDCCSDCHTWLDQRMGTEEDILFYTRRALIRTLKRRMNEGYIAIV